MENDTWRNTKKQRREFLMALEALPDVEYACRRAGITVEQALTWKARWKSFSAMRRFRYQRARMT